MMPTSATICASPLSLNRSFRPSVAMSTRSISSWRMRACSAGKSSIHNGFHGSFDFGGITWANYKGGGTIGIDTNKCHLFPTGVPGLFRTVYGPADYIETVNTPGQRLYAKQWEMMNGKGVNLEFQMNALHYCTRPRVLIPGKRT